MKNKPIILVTGAAGQLGISLQEEAKNHPHYQWHFYKRKELDITKPGEVERVFEELRPTFCINTAAYTNVKQAEFEKQEARLVNVTAAAHLAKICAYCNTQLIHLSTDYVFDGAQAYPYTEGDRPNPVNHYGKTKAEGEALVLAESENHYVVRTAWLYASTHGHNFYRSILSKAIAGESLQVVNDQVGTPTSTTQLCAYLLRLIEKQPPGGIYHCAGETIQSWYGFAKDILKAHQLEVPLQEIRTPSIDVKRPRFSALSTTKRF